MCTSISNITACIICSFIDNSAEQRPRTIWPWIQYPTEGSMTSLWRTTTRKAKVFMCQNQRKRTLPTDIGSAPCKQCRPGGSNQDRFKVDSRESLQINCTSCQLSLKRYIICDQFTYYVCTEIFYSTVSKTASTLYWNFENSLKKMLWCS